MSRSNKKNRRLNKKKKNVGRNQGETSTTPVVDHSVEFPRVDRNDYTDHAEPTGNVWEEGSVSAKESGTFEKEIEKSTENEIDTKVVSLSIDEIEQQDSDLKGKPQMDLQSNKQIAEDDATSITESSKIQRKGRGWTSCVCCCGILDILRVIMKGGCS